jgi:putative phosphoribosyl transferase
MAWADEEVKVELAEGLALQGHLTLPERVRGLVVFAHGSGSSRHSPRNGMVARALENAGLGTLLLDLLTAQEEEAERDTLALRFDIGLLAGRLEATLGWLARTPATRALRYGLFGASTGAAAALVAAARSPQAVHAVVSRGGRPDLAGGALPRVLAPTLLIVGGADRGVLAFNEQALTALPGPKHMEVIPGAGHLFEEPGALGRVAELAGRWFVQHLGAARWQETAHP